MGPSQRGGTIIGAASGAGLGLIAGNNVRGISKTEGAIAGALVGGLVGNQMGKQRDEIRSLQEESHRTVIHVQNRDGSSTPVMLKQIGSNTWRGPRGEIYTGFPSRAQLANRYAD